MILVDGSLITVKNIRVCKTFLKILVIRHYMENINIFFIVPEDNIVINNSSNAGEGDQDRIAHPMSMLSSLLVEALG